MPGSPPGCKNSLSGVTGHAGIFQSFSCGWRFSQLECPAAGSAPQSNTHFFLYSLFSRFGFLFLLVCFLLAFRSMTWSSLLRLSSVGKLYHHLIETVKTSSHFLKYQRKKGNKKNERRGKGCVFCFVSLWTPNSF